MTRFGEASWEFEGPSRVTRAARRAQVRCAQPSPGGEVLLATLTREAIRTSPTTGTTGVKPNACFRRCEIRVLGGAQNQRASGWLIPFQLKVREKQEGAVNGCFSASRRRRKHTSFAEDVFGDLVVVEDHAR